MSFMYNINNRGPRIDPWGTPQEIELRSEFVLFHYFALIKLHCVIVMPKQISFTADIHDNTESSHL